MKITLLDRMARFVGAASAVIIAHGCGMISAESAMERLREILGRYEDSEVSVAQHCLREGA